MLGLVVSGLVEWVLLLAAVTGGAVTIVGVINRWFIKPLVRGIESKIEDHIHPVLGEVRVVRHEVTYNHGTSLKDKVRDLGSEVAHIKGQIEILTQMIGDK